MITGPHLAISACRWLRKPSGVILSALGMSELSSARRLVTIGSAMAVFSAAFSLSITSLGVPLGAYMPCHTFTSKPFRPCSSSVGTSGSDARRLCVVTP